MEDFDYSVEICDRDWECFFAECEECNLLPPSIAGLDDSGMSDIDDTRSILAKRVQKVDLKGSFSEADRTIDGPPHHEGSPVEYYLSRHGVSGMESVLSGSEEDIHLQSVNMFFERLKNGTEAESLTEPSQVRDGEKNMEEEKCSDGQQASCSILPKNCPKLNSPSARGETAVGKETAEPVNTTSNIMKTMKKSGSTISPEPAASNSVHKTKKSAHAETKFFIREEAGTITRVNEATHRNLSHAPPDKVTCSGTPHINKGNKAGMCSTQDDAKKEQLLTGHLTLSKPCSADSWSNLEMLTNVKGKKDQNSTVSQSDATSTKTACQESSPSASMKRKRRKKRRLSIEPAESVHGHERQVSVKQSDSEEEQRARRGGTSLCVSEEFKLAYLNQPQNHFMPLLTTNSAPSCFPVMIPKVNDLSHYSRPCESQYQYLQESLARHTGSIENNAPYDRPVTQLSPPNNSVMSEQNHSGNVAAILQPCSKLQVEDSTGPNKYSGLPVSITDLVSGKSAHAGSLWQPDDSTNSIIYCNNNEHNPVSCTTEVKSITNRILPSTESSDRAVEVSQNDKLSAAKSILALEAGNSVRTNYTLCQREAEPQQQLETDRHYTDEYSSTLGKTQFPLTAIGTSSSDAHNTKPKPMNNRACPSVGELSSQVDCVGLTLDASNSLPDKRCQSKSLPTLDVDMTDKQTERPLLLQTLPKLVFSSEKDTTAERAELAASQIVAIHNGNPVPSGEINQTGKNQGETKFSMSEDLLTSPSDLTPVSSCLTLDTESLMSLSNENITDMAESSCLSVSQNNSEGQGEKTSLLLAIHEENNGTCTPKSESVSKDITEYKCDLVVEDEDCVTASKAERKPEKAPGSKHSVFAMSSFWNEMEKLTINDILGLRMINTTASSSSLPPLQECEETDTVSMTDSGFFTQLDDSKPEQTNEDTFSEINHTESSSDSVMAVNPSSSKSVMWDREPVALSPGDAIYPKNMLTSVCDISQPGLPGSAQMCHRKISKNISVHNLPALESESFSYSLKGQSLQTLDEGQFEEVEFFTDGHVSKQDKDMDCSAPSSTDSYRISLTDIFQYLFGGKQLSPSQSATDLITSRYTDGNSVSETYDHFFSEFDTESFFYPLIRTEDQTKDKRGPIIFCSPSANRNLQYPEAYEHFFASSSSDDSSDEEDSCSPVRVVTRFNRTSSAPKICTDIYDNFFRDSDLRQNFFWKNTLSFRNMNFAGSTVQKQTLSTPLTPAPLRQSGRSLRRTIQPINVLGNQDVMFADPLIYHLEDKISRQLALQPFRYEDLQVAVSNPRLDASLLPLRHSDMCLLCIAFASWVLKTTNPQVGDAWKAVLLANVSALSAIRYLRKYVRMEAAASQKKLQYTSLSEP